VSLLLAKEHLDNGNAPEAGAMITAALNEDPDSNEWLFLYARAMSEAERPAFARLALEHLTRGEGRKRWQVWLNLGKAYDDLGWHDRAQGCFRKVLSLEPGQTQAIRNLSTSNVQQGHWAQAEKWARLALESGTTEAQPHIDLAYTCLNTSRYGEGWDEYAYGIDNMTWRKRKDYAGEPQWNGEPSQVVITGEQGVGDQIAYMSCLRDAQERTGATFTAIDCYPKLAGLFGRTFAGIPTYGDMFKTETTWTVPVQHSAVMSLLPKFSRREAADYPGTPYLKPCPIRIEQWRRHFAALPGKKIGIAWTGGIAKTGQSKRSTTPDTFKPLTDQCATFIDLEYREHDPVPGVHSFPWATRTNDYDDTAAMVACLDLVICVPTSVAHLAGALGVPCWVIQHETPHFFFADGCRIWQSVTNYHRKSDWSVIEKVAADLRGFLAD